MSVIVKEVKKRDMKRWVRFPNILYKENKAFVP